MSDENVCLPWTRRASRNCGTSLMDYIILSCQTSPWELDILVWHFVWRPSTMNNLSLCLIDDHSPYKNLDRGINFVPSTTQNQSRWQTIPKGQSSPVGVNRLLSIALVLTFFWRVLVLIGVGAIGCVDDFRCSCFIHSIHLGLLTVFLY